MSKYTFELKKKVVLEYLNGSIGYIPLAKKYDIKIMVDVICNHMGHNGIDPFTPSEKVEKRLLNDPDFWKEPRQILDFDDRFEVTNYCIGLPGLNTANHELQKIMIDFLRSVIDCGVDGLRFDAARHTALPSEGNDFWPNITNNLREYKENLIICGEVIFEPNKNILKEYCKYIDLVTDNRKIDPDKLICFCESHDTFLSEDIDERERTRKYSSSEIAKKYVKLNKNYPNSIFFIRPDDNIWRSDMIRKALSV